MTTKVAPLLLVTAFLVAGCRAQVNVEGNNVVAALGDEKEGIEEAAGERLESDDVIAELSRLIYGDMTEMDIISALLGNFDDGESTEDGSSSASIGGLGLSGILKELSKNVSEACVYDVARYLEDLLESKPYALKSKLKGSSCW